MGLATFAVQYPLVYEAETHLASAIVAVLFAAMAFVNLVVFRLLFGERASGVAWLAAALGIAGVALLSWGELSATQMDRSASWGLLVCAGAILAASLGNASARAAQTQGASVIASTAWAMTYGAGALALYALASGAEWSFDPRPTYILSLIYLAVFGSVVAFLLYFGLARRRGFAAASYISALTPPVAMLVSTVFESKAWTALTLFGVAVIVAGQWLLSRIPRA
jgi:drug/metabolite transporter (DMT)-like permease